MILLSLNLLMEKMDGIPIINKFFFIYIIIECLQPPPEKYIEKLENDLFAGVKASEIQTDAKKLNNARVHLDPKEPIVEKNELLDTQNAHVNINFFIYK